MHTKFVILNPIRSTEEEIRQAREVARSQLRSLWWFGGFLFLMSGVAIYSMVTVGTATGFLVPLGMAAFLIWGISRCRWLVDVRSIEKRFTIREDSLVLDVVFNDRDSTKNVIPWKEVLFAKETKDAVELRLRSGGTQKVPNECFSTEEQKKLLLQRANPACRPIP